MRESVVEKHLANRVRDTLGGLAYKFKAPGRANVEDRLCLLPHGRVWLVELKAPGEKPTEAQAREHARHRALGHNVAVLDSIAAVDDWVTRRHVEGLTDPRMRAS